MFGVDRTVDRSGEYDASALLEMDEGVGPARVVRRATRPGNRDQPSPLHEAGERRGNVTKRGVGHASVDVGER
jgi:hypothetical protein